MFKNVFQMNSKKIFLYLNLVSITNIFSQQKPNIVLILADDLGYNDLSCYRNNTDNNKDSIPTTHTPNIDQLAKEGMLFTNFYSGSAVCSPSRAALITGRNASRLGIYNWIPEHSPMHLRNEEETIAEVLKTKNYRTGHFGKWHLTSEGMNQPLPGDQGFDYTFFTFNNAMPSHHNPNSYILNGQKMGEIKGYACQIVVDEAIKWLEMSSTSESPFFVNIWFNEPHEKEAAPAEFANRHKFLSQYYGAIENMDNAIGRIISYLNDKKLNNNTLIIFTSDNGSEKMRSNEPFRGEKCFNYEGGIRVPFIVKMTNYIPQNTVSDLPACFTDIMPTIHDFVKSNHIFSKKLDGVSLLDIWNGNQTSINRKEPLFFHRYFHEPICMLRDGDWCLLGFEENVPVGIKLNVVEMAKIKPANDDPRWSQWGFQKSHMNIIEGQIPKYFQLFNLKNDIKQLNDISNQNPDIVDSMKIKMLHLQKELIQEGGNWFKN